MPGPIWIRDERSGIRRQPLPDGGQRDGRSSLFDALPQPAIEYATDGGTPTVRRVNAAFHDEFGGTIGDDRFAELLEQIQDGDGETVRFEGEILGVDRTLRARTVTLADSEGRYVLLDRTETVETRSGLDLVDFLTHSVRNPLEVAKIHAEVARESGDIEYIRDIEEALERIEQITEDTLALAREGQIVGETEPTAVGTVARNAWDTVRTHGATLTVGDPGTILADQGRLRELFENLFRNAVVHGSADEDDAADLTVTVDATEDGFYVADDGTGIPKPDREQVLEFGYTTSESGTGLGLTIVADIANSHGWDLNVVESADGGARFEFTGTEQVSE